MNKEKSEKKIYVQILFLAFIFMTIIQCLDVKIYQYQVSFLCFLARL